MNTPTPDPCVTIRCDDYWATVDAVATRIAAMRDGATWPVSAQDIARSVLASLGLTANRKQFKTMKTKIKTHYRQGDVLIEHSPGSRRGGVR